jgi:hypothetical protein
MDQRKYERIKARLMQKKREAGDALKAIAHKRGNPLVSREYGKAMDRYQKAKEALERHYENQRDDAREPKAETDTKNLSHTCPADVPALQDPHVTLAGPDDQQIIAIQIP